MSRSYTSSTPNSYMACSGTAFKGHLDRSRWPCGVRRRSAAARLLGSRFPVPLGAWMFVVFICCVVLFR
jgi:hypothetical protein